MPTTIRRLIGLSAAISTVVLGLTVPSVAPAADAVGPPAPANGVIGMVAKSGSTNRWVTVKPDGTGLTIRTLALDSAASLYWLDVSKDGTRIAFLERQSISEPDPDSGRLCTARIDGTDVRCADPGFSTQFSGGGLAWSSTGQDLLVSDDGNLVFTPVAWSPVDGDDVPAYAGLYVDRISTSRTRGLLASRGDAGYSWVADYLANTPPTMLGTAVDTGTDGAKLSPDGSRIAYLADGTQDLHVVDIDAGTLGTDVTLPGAEDGRYTAGPAWSGDGTQLVYVQYDEPGSRHLLRTISVATGQVTTMLDLNAEDVAADRHRLAAAAAG